jgi:hypothetical protein
MNEVLCETLVVGEKVWPAFVVLRKSKRVEVRGTVVVAWPKVASRPEAGIDRAVLARGPGIVTFAMAVPWAEFQDRMPDREGFGWAPEGWVPKKLLLRDPLNGIRVGFVQRAFAEAKRSVFMRKQFPDFRLRPDTDVLPALRLIALFLVPGLTFFEETETDVTVDSISALELFGGRGMVVRDRKVTLAVDEARRRILGRLGKLINQRIRDSGLWKKAVEDIGRKKIKVRGAPDHLPCFRAWKNRVRTLKSMKHEDRMMAARWANTFPEIDIWGLVPSELKNQTQQARRWSRMGLGSCTSMGRLCVVDIEDLALCQKQGGGSVVEWAAKKHLFR